ncbi:MAG TPA: substrate-binding domain-containing protein [Acidobacteriota bacterium]|nr:substrate-binding domain-containing protein [Acidobacteriota bacterium]
MRLSKIVSGILLVLMIASTMTCRKKDRLVIAVVPKGQSQIYWQTVHAGAVAAGRELGVEILWNGPASEIDLTREINIVDDFINQRVDGIVLAPSHGESLVPIVERASQERIPVTIIDSGIKTEKYLTYVSTDNYKGGILAARRLGQVLPEGGMTAMIGNIPGSVSTTERENGFRATIAAEFPRLQIVEFQYGMADRAKSMAVAEDILTAHPDLLGIFCSNEAATLGAVQAAKSKGVAGKLKIAGFDTSPTLIEDLQSGNIDSLVVQNPFRMGYLGVKTVVSQLRGKPPEKRIDTGATVVTAANLKEPSIQELVFPPIEKYLR